jgi:NADH:ubiquinone oxidoreductase subunit C
MFYLFTNSIFILNIFVFLNLISCDNYKFYCRETVFYILLNETLESFIYFLFFLKHCCFSLIQLLVDITAIDNIVKTRRFIIFYNFLNIQYNSRLIILFSIKRSRNLPSLQNYFFCANWMERELYDMFGIFFFSHSDLRRILTDYGFTGYPLRKDFPLSGYQEVFFEDNFKNIFYSKITLQQQYRKMVSEKIWIT